MQCAARVISHQDLHLSLGKVLDVFIERAGLTVFALRGAVGCLVLLVTKKSLAVHGHAAPCHRVFSRGPQEIPGGCLVTGAQRKSRVRRRGHIFLKAPADLHQLRQTLHGEQKRGVGAAGGLQDLCEVAVSEGRKLVQHDAEHRAVGAPPLLRTLVPFAHDQLQVLQQHLPQSSHGLGVLVDVQGNEQDQLLLDHFVERQQVLIRSGDHAQFIVEKRHTLVDQALDLRYALAVCKRLVEVSNRHLEVQSPLHGDRWVVFQTLARLFDLFAQHLFVNCRDQNVIDVDLPAGVHQHANDVGQIIQLVLGKELVVQVEGAEDHVDDRHVVLVVAVERVVPDRDIWARGIQNSELVQPSGTVDMRQKVVEELKIPFAVKDHHRQPVWILWGADHAGHVLRNDVLQKRGLAGAGHAQHDALHDADSVRPIPRLAVDVVAENDGVLLPGFGSKLFVPFAGNNHRWMGPRLLPPRAPGSNQYRGSGDG